MALVFAIASLALSTIVPLHHLQVVWACVIDAYLNPGMILYVLFHAFVR